MAAEAAADKLRNERRDVERVVRLLFITHLVGVILPQEAAERARKGGFWSAGGGPSWQPRNSKSQRQPLKGADKS